MMLSEFDANAEAFELAIKCLIEYKNMKYTRHYDGMVKLSEPFGVTPHKHAEEALEKIRKVLLSTEEKELEKKVIQ
jgi:hypothetical protein